MYALVGHLQSHSILLTRFSVKFEGPWFTTQASLSTVIGVTSFLIFCYCRTRWPLLFAPRTKLKGAFIDSIRICTFS